MKCEKCGAKISDGNLYCEKCGEEITIVPLFEPELESRLNENLHKISDDIIEQANVSGTTGTIRTHRYLRFVILLVLCSLLIGAISLIYLFNSKLYQINRGNIYLAEGNYQDALNCYERVLQKQPENSVEIYMYMIECYENLGYDGQYEEYLLLVIDNPEKTETQEYMAYAKLIQFYREGNSFQTINTLLKNCKSDKIIEQFKSYLVSTPVFHHDEGVYYEIIPLKISSPEGYNIYYTLDGTQPTRDSLKYTEPIFLDDGIYDFRAICMNEYGVYSDVVAKKYEIIFTDE